VVGLVIIAVDFLSLPPNVGVGTSAYIGAAALLWIGGMVMFGIGTLISAGHYQFRRPSIAQAAASAPLVRTEIAPFKF